MIEVRCPGCRHLLLKIWRLPLQIVIVCKHCPKPPKNGGRAKVAITFPAGARDSIPSVAMVKEELPTGI
jgi:hypothetical protein